MEMTGGWSEAVDRMADWPKKLHASLERATLQNAVGLVGEIKRGIVSQEPGGQKFAPLHPFTIAQRKAAMSSGARKKLEASGGQHKALLNHGDLLGAIAYVIGPDKLSARVGVKRAAVGETDLVNIARVLSEGRVIEVTPKMRVWLHANGLHLKKTTNHIVIPPRPFIEPVFRAYRAQILERYKKALRVEI